MRGAGSVNQKLPAHPVEKVPVFESYRVLPEIFEDIVQKLGCKRPQIDLFADQDNKLCEKYWSAENDAFAKDWSEFEYFWCNPPYSMMGRVVEKIKTDGVQGILIAPEWRTRDWWDPLNKMVEGAIYFPMGTKLFETEKGPAGPTKWGAWAMLVNGKRDSEAMIGRVSHENNPESRENKNDDTNAETVYLRGLTRVRPMVRDVHLKVKSVIKISVDEYECRALIDTGAEVNLVRRGLCNTKYTRVPEKSYA